MAFGRAEVNGIHMYYRMAGSGEPVVLLHGFPETSHTWRKVMPALADTAPCSRRTCAASAIPIGRITGMTSAPSPKTFTNSFINLVLDPLTSSATTLASWLVMTYASAYPSEVKRLVLMEAALPELSLEKQYDADKYPRMYHLPLFEAPNGFAEALITGREKMFVWHFMRQQAYNTAALEGDILDGYAERLAAPGALRAGIAYFPGSQDRRRAQPEEC